MFSTIQAAFESQRDSERAEQMAAYMRHQFAFYGIPSRARRDVYKTYLRHEKKKGEVDWELLDRCWADPHREFQYFVADYLAALQPSLVYEDVPRIKRYLDTKQWWDTIDALDGVVGDIGLRDGRVDAVMIAWSTDADFWIRRVAIDHQLGRKEKTKPDLLEKIIVANFGSDEFFINKAIGWSLREYSKTDPDWVRDFVGRYREKMAPLSIREASKYL